MGCTFLLACHNILGTGYFRQCIIATLGTPPSLTVHMEFVSKWLIYFGQLVSLPHDGSSVAPQTTDAQSPSSDSGLRKG